MGRSLAVINCKQLVSLAGPARPRIGAELRDLSIIEDGALLVVDDRVSRTGKRNEIDPHITSECEVIDAAAA
jgi:imidazolonepropionase